MSSQSPADPLKRQSGEARAPSPERDNEQFDHQRRRLFWTMPSGLYLLGSCSGEARNLMTLSWATQVSAEPKLIGVSVENSALTHNLVETSGLFALSVVSRADRAVVRKFVKPCIDDRASMTLNGIAYLDARSTGLPVLAGALGYFECEVRARMPFVSHTFFVGEVVDVSVSPGIAGGEEPDVLSMRDTRMNYGG
ncbi:MAG TPA: flavin reductase family protein [Acidimicrobiales bacterium]|nr:flavin reductase family protein [Acidimicrobiales bacterium]